MLIFPIDPCHNPYQELSSFQITYLDIGANLLYNPRVFGLLHIDFYEHQDYDNWCKQYHKWIIISFSFNIGLDVYANIVECGIDSWEEESRKMVEQIMA